MIVIRQTKTIKFNLCNIIEKPKAKAKEKRIKKKINCHLEMCINLFYLALKGD
jgi:hypothetical protein